MPPRHIQYPLREAQLSKKYRIKNRGGNRKCLHNRKRTNRLSSSAIMRWSEVTRTPFSRVRTKAIHRSEIAGSCGDETAMAATNQPEVLDKALLRPGRFDRRVVKFREATVLEGFHKFEGLCAIH
jgi:hypothetical protein